MSGLLSGVLPWAYSQGDSLKRQIKGLLADPGGTVTQYVNNVNDRAGEFNRLTTEATKEGVASMRAGRGIQGEGPASNRLAQLLADAYNPIGMTVWHGSPHQFSKFDASKIGTGEGAQAYGHGLYLAESPAVAKDYASRLPDASSPYTYWWNNQSYEKGALKDPTAHALGLIYHDSQATAKRIAKQGLADAKAGQPYALEMGGVDYYQRMLDVATQANKKGIKATQGSLYKVDLPDEAIAKMLDWDKPLSQQSDAVKAAARKLGVDMEKAYGGIGGSGENLYKATRNNPALLTEFGIPGIRYLDGGSRGTGQGTSNFVVFPGNENLLTILERNGQPTGLLAPKASR